MELPHLGRVVTPLWPGTTIVPGVVDGPRPTDRAQPSAVRSRSDTVPRQLSANVRR